MTCCPTTTLLPPSLPYTNLEEVIVGLCDLCLKITESNAYSESDKQQYFEIAISLIDFWETELEGISAREL